MVPINMRRGEEAPGEIQPAANIVSVVFLDRQSQEMNSPLGLLESISREMQLIKRRELGAIFIHSLELTRWLPGGLEQATGQQTGSVSTVLTNLGPFLADWEWAETESNTDSAAGTDTVPLKVVDCCLWPPLPQGSALSFAVGAVGGKIQWGISHDACRVSRERVAYLWERIVSQLNEYSSLRPTGLSTGK